MFQFIFAQQNSPFAFALGLMLAIALAEGVGTFLGLGLSNMIDSMLPDMDVDIDLDADIPDFEAGVSSVGSLSDLDVSGSGSVGGAEGATQGLFTQVLGWLCFGRVPALVLLVIFLTAFGLSGFVLQSLFQGVTGWMLPGAVAGLVAFVVAIPSTRFFGLILSRIIPKVETDAVSRSTFVGKVALMVQADAKTGAPAQARLKDSKGQSHYVLVEPDVQGEVLAHGEEVIIVRQVGARYSAIKNTNATLSGSQD
ncbi:YqiJ family protein [Roseibium algae]|uniref:YqiJ family protein n=1 Tax=Roseibium algae TaxID=3123038 RepID=A0ABU8TIG5_9HYPH